MYVFASHIADLSWSPTIGETQVNGDGLVEFKGSVFVRTISTTNLSTPKFMPQSSLWTPLYMRSAVTSHVIATFFYKWGPCIYGLFHSAVLYRLSCCSRPDEG